MRLITPFPVLLLALAALLGGCAEEWVKPGATPAQFEADEARCLSDAYRRFPPAEVSELASEAYFTAPEKRCDANGYRCYRIPPEYVPARFQTRDTNGPPRNADVRACLFRRGWTPKP
jgi:hypothetical protein